MESTQPQPGTPPVRKQLADYFELVDLDFAGPVASGPFSLECRRTIHGVPTTAFRIHAGGRTFGFSADTAYDPTLIDWLALADLIVHEATTMAHSGFTPPTNWRPCPPTSFQDAADSPSRRFRCGLERDRTPPPGTVLRHISQGPARLPRGEPRCVRLTIAIVPILGSFTFVGEARGQAGRPQLVEARKIWDHAPDNAFTDLVRFHDRWFCVFREGQRHVSPDGAIRVISSADGRDWSSSALLTQVQADLRHPKINVTPDGRLMIAAAAARDRKPNGAARHQSMVWFSTDGEHWDQRS